MEETVTISRESYDELTSREDYIDGLESQIDESQNRKIIWRYYGNFIHDYTDIKSDDEVFQSVIKAAEKRHENAIEKLKLKHLDDLAKLMGRNLIQRIFNKL
tara:strand:- start:38 stop:343 length:306 start_codon:yes stop_codon:yes gene_type:complete